MNNMTQEEITLLFKDLSCRVPYSPLLNIDGFYDKPYNFDEELFSVNMDNSIMYVNDRVLSIDATADTIKPYLRSMLSMTEEEWKSVPHWNFVNGSIDLESSVEYIDWLNSHHFDFRNLIGKGLALEAPEGMYKTE